jgi:hypothetical protein
MTEAIVIDRALTDENREEIWRCICMIAEMNQMTPRQYITYFFKGTGDFDFLDLDSINWCALFRDTPPKDEDIVDD